ncbi:hypothetical protein AN0522.2 [Aspergillus nidulans FGSC A4]|uniref:Uncharacterized protein n=1 Tax=Emericella nidulans (strain FGSC A4 / ATCC 38163 / CBS 112.46 / NRRL 194 / M139) TaxID=227321 RepID=Q5BG08_EMENI|nr:hypothetical protein [Aspergillus nidulans FGSC A4]EAA66621.1 hypothetical protein AN0522.2 [Aspergillus nidulans FGSC A4]CBF89314.1 TPA: hypothetical protein ANIA_00522 [Aspergillus nidulans FGSC A4]|eukprot:XP_658126.1 hypothetical protein AN0522.2 [Aspergillus nidulans FGSC A4]
MKQGAVWSLVNQSLSHFAPSVLNYADEILREVHEDQQNGWPDNETDESDENEEDGVDENEGESEESEAEDSESDSEYVYLSIEFIHFFHEPYCRVGIRATHSDETDNGESLLDDLMESKLTDRSALEWLQVQCGKAGDIA